MQSLSAKCDPSSNLPTFLCYSYSPAQGTSPSIHSSSDTLSYSTYHEMDSFFTLFALTASATVAAPASAPTEASATTQSDFPFEVVDEETAGKSGNSYCIIA
ncbi:hypothetical protein D9619_002245 [Psilocybe cf. subviscida]|uniref:Pheromone n=1 Tax=Psilocybe cf. subviscida TaxID=2480587 RepID=A0A8H5F395_9AGAR|nr:hypothetical protein D9619_002245 [Psilocybe cf. subviscida]